MSDRFSQILVVDDDDAIRTMLERVLRRENFQVDVARDGQEAIDKLADDGSYGIILLDLMMPRVDGLGVIRYLEQHRPDVERSVIVMTANMQLVGEAASARPVYRVMPKPFDIRQVIATIRERLAAMMESPITVPSSASGS